MSLFQRGKFTLAYGSKWQGFSWFEEAYEQIAKLEAEIAKMRYFMSVRIDFDGERTVLDVFEDNRDSIQ